VAASMNKKREHILLVSEQLFAQKGFDAVSTREIALKAKINIAMIAYYFGSKEKLYDAVIDYRLFSFEEYLPELNNLPSNAERLSLLLNVLVDKFLERRYFQQIVFRELSTSERHDLTQKIRLRLFSNFSYLLQTIARGIDNKEFAKVNIPFTLLSIIGTLRMYINAEDVMQPVGLMFFSFDNAEKSKNELKEHLLLLIGNHLKVSLKPYNHA
jgi:AcrR family transcriptional regulator